MKQAMQTKLTSLSSAIFLLLLVVGVSGCAEDKHPTINAIWKCGVIKTWIYEKGIPSGGIEVNGKVEFAHYIPETDSFNLKLHLWNGVSRANVAIDSNSIAWYYPHGKQKEDAIFSGLCERIK